MTLNSTDGLSDNGVDETLYSFSQRKQDLFFKFSIELNKNQLWKKLAAVAIEKGILSSKIRSKLDNPNGSLYVINEFMKINSTIGLLYQCLINHEFRHLVKLLGVFEQIHVVKQPGNSSGNPLKTWAGQELTLTFQVQGYPIPRFQWFYNSSPIKCATNSTLILSSFSKQMEGEYHCEAKQSNLNLPTVTLVSDRVECVLIILAPRLLMDLPPEMICFENKEVTLSVLSDEDCSYEWIRNHQDNQLLNQVISLSNSNKFCIKRITKQNEGKYKCVLKNSAGETCSSVCHLKVEVPAKIQAKMALLIGNCDYHNLSKLNTPSADVKLLAKTLKKLGFFVVSLTNLNIEEFRSILSWFNSIIPKKALVFFFFSGHGFELANNKFLLPVDCPPSHCYKISDCICYQFIVQQIMIRKPLLSILILDMCLKGPNRMNNPNLYDENIEHYDYDLPNATSIVEACATSDYQQAYERNTDINGLYLICLCDHIVQDLPILKNFDNAHNDFLKRGQINQKPQLKYNNGQTDLKLITKPLKDSSKMENKVVRSVPNYFIANLQEAGIYLLFVFVPDEFILNSIDISILPLSNFKILEYSLFCPEAKFRHVGLLEKKSNKLSCITLTINDLHKIEAMKTLYIQCAIIDVEGRTLQDIAKIKINPPFILNFTT